MNAYLVKELNALKRNILSGILLAFFRKSAFHQYRISFDQAALLILFDFFLSFIVDYVKYLPQPELNSYGIAGYGMQIFGLLITAFILAKLAKDNFVALRFVVLASSLTPFFYIVGTILMEFSASQTLYYSYVFWALAVVAFVMHHCLGRHIGKTIISIGGYGLFAVSPTYFIDSGELWYPQLQEDSYYIKYKSINQEKLFYDQFDYLDTLQRDLLPGRQSTTDLYFLGFGSYSTEDVFMKEIHYIQDLMDREYDTRGRSVALINNPSTIKDTPLATVSNLNRALMTIGKSMDREEDVLFLYLTSHGSRKPELSVSFWPLSLNQVTPTGLRHALDEAAIKWRIILISACYSGGFLEPLKNENTIIMTAADKDSTSFGCGTKSDFTYFGRAVFIDQLANNHSFISSFENAKKLIATREKQEKLAPSNPQLSIGFNIRSKLNQLEKELNTHYRRDLHANNRLKNH